MLYKNIIKLFKKKNHRKVATFPGHFKTGNLPSLRQPITFLSSLDSECSAVEYTLLLWE